MPDETEEMGEQERNPIARLTGPTPEEVKQEREAEAQTEEEVLAQKQQTNEAEEGKASTLGKIAEGIEIRRAAGSLLKSHDEEKDT